MGERERSEGVKVEGEGKLESEGGGRRGSEGGERGRSEAVRMYVCELHLGGEGMCMWIVWRTMSGVWE